MELFTNPWFIIILVVCFMVGNIAALRYVSYLKLKPNSKTQQTDAEQERRNDKALLKELLEESEKSTPEGSDPMTNNSASSSTTHPQNKD
ncbi:DUF2897 family protein [Vibrio cholerae]